MAACNKLTGMARDACLKLSDPNVYCAQASSDPNVQAKCLDYSADPCQEILGAGANPVALAACRQGIQGVLQGAVGMEDLAKIGVAAAGAAGCASIGLGTLAPLCASAATAIYNWIKSVFTSDPPSTDTLALWVLQLSRGTYQTPCWKDPGNPGCLPGGQQPSRMVPKYNDAGSVAAVRKNLKALGLDGIWNLPGGAQQSRGVVKIVLTATRHLNHAPGWWVTRRLY